MVTLNATVTDASHPADTVNEGTVTFTLKNGATVIGSPVTANVSSTGKATVNYGIPDGYPISGSSPYTIVVSYSDTNPGSGNYIAGTVNTGALTINAASVTATAVAASTTYRPSPGQATVNLTANVTDISHPADTVNEGTVVFTVLNGSTAIGSSGPVTFNNGAASTTYTLPAGLAVGSSYTITVSYTDNSGTVNFMDSGSDTSAKLTVNAANVATTASSTSTGYSQSSQTVALSATVADTSNPGDPVTEGTVAFTVKSGSTVIGSSGPVTFNTSTDTATTTYTLPAGAAGGAYTVVAAYTDNSGTINFVDGGPDSHGTLTITSASVATTAVTSSAFYSAATQTISLKATIADNSHPSDTVNEGTVSFTLTDGQGHTIGSQVGTATVSGGSATGSYSLPAGATGPYTIAATYTDSAGSSSYTDNGPDVTGTLTINPAVTVTTPAAAGAPYSSASQTVTLTANVADSSHPGDTVTDGTVAFTLTKGGSVVATRSARPRSAAAAPQAATACLPGRPARTPSASATATSARPAAISSMAAATPPARSRSIPPR